MCGIAGAVNYSGIPNFDRVKRMSQAMAYRGPDNQGVASYGSCVLGHRRLSIIDLSDEANQPFGYGDKAIVFNGEIYNYRELRSDLLKSGMEFRTSSDTEVILVAYEAWGLEKLCQRLTGMFAFAIWDRTKEELILARDRFGEKPMYYAEEGNSFLFSSVATTIARSSDNGVVLSRDGLQSYLQLGYCHQDYEIFEGIRALPPASYAVLHAKGLSISRYWDIGFSTDSMTFDQALTSVEELLRKSVERQMEADVPLGCLLSGGVDSTLVASISTEFNPNMHLYTVRMPDSSLDESDIARETARQIGGRHRVIEAEPIHEDDFAALMGQFSQPLGDASALGVWMVAQEAKKEVSVVLTGDGGDEFFEGYNTVPLHLSVKNLRKIFRNPIGKGVGSSIDTLTRGIGYQRHIRKAGTFLKLVSTSHMTYHTQKSLLPSGHSKILSGFEESKASLDQHLMHIWNDSPSADDRYAQAYFDIKTDLPGDYLAKVDTATMAHSLESRSPFLDHKLAEFGYSLPVEYKFYNGQPKGILKQLLKKRVGPDLFSQISEGKRGFVVPIDTWFNGSWAGLVEDLLNSPLFDDGYLNKSEVRKIVERAQRNPYVYSRIRYSLIALDLWYRQTKLKIW